MDIEQTNIGECADSNRNEKLISIEAINERPIYKINGTYLCYKQSKYNYHHIVENRDIGNKPNKGEKDDGSRRDQ